MTSTIVTYISKIAADYKRGTATELTYRSSLEWLIETLSPGVDASNDPQHIACGAPDFIVERGNVPLGYVETKDVGADLNRVERSDQLKRYLSALHNLILTDYLEFRWYVNGEKRMTVRIATVDANGHLKPDKKGIASADALFQSFYQTEVPTIGTPRDLARRMAELTHLVRDLLVAAITEECETGVFHKQIASFREFLLPELKAEEFADIYAQTMAYGMFASALNRPEGQPFSRSHAYLYMPPANPFLRKIFMDVGEELDGTPIAPFLDDLASLLSHADLAAILRDFGKWTRTEDPVVHFYETFLAAYDPKMREKRGVYYTPEPVVQFIVNSVDCLLKSKFGRVLGLSDPNSLILDPATGTGTFLYCAIRKIHEEQMESGQGGMWKEYVREKLLPRIFGFELLMAPYAVAHLKLGLLLKELGYDFGKRERLGVFLTNSLEEGVTHSQTLGLAGYLSEEGSLAAEVKKQKPIEVVLGNPPYSGHSANKGEWICNLVRDYYFVDGAPLGERNPKWLQDDYVKFIRFGEWHIQQTGHGILAFISNHGYLDNPTFRGMRQHLMNTFDEIYVLDLHGNSKKKEKAPGGGLDQNVFDIQQGVAILLAVKRRESCHGKPAQVFHADLWGTRIAKYVRLDTDDVNSIGWDEIEPRKPFYLFLPQTYDLKAEFDMAWSVGVIFQVNSLGITTARDDFAVAFDRQTIEQRLSDFRNQKVSDNDLLEKYKLHETQSWKIAQSRLRLKTQYRSSVLRQIDYRPFDLRWTYHDSAILERDRSEVLNHMHQPGNLALVTLRRPRGQDTWNYTLVGTNPVDKSYITSLDNAFVFPLYLYTTPEDTAITLFAQTEITRKANLSKEFVQAFSATVGLIFIPDGRGDLLNTFGPEDLFDYAYAIFHSPTYRTRYAEFLKIDFPRLPLTSDPILFTRLVGFGKELISFHLMTSPNLDRLITTFSVAGSNRVERIQYADDGCKVVINNQQYFGNVPADIWRFTIGGYQVCEKWLKDRKGRTLSGDDIMHYQKIIVALKRTTEIMDEIDEAIGEFPIQ